MVAEEAGRVLLCTVSTWPGCWGQQGPRLTLGSSAGAGHRMEIFPTSICKYKPASASWRFAAVLLPWKQKAFFIFRFLTCFPWTGGSRGPGVISRHARDRRRCPAPPLQCRAVHARGRPRHGGALVLYFSA